MDADLTGAAVPGALPPQLPVVRYRFTARLQDPLEWPAFPGALLRSVFGLNLRRLSCLTGADRCSGCHLQRTCPYPALFETPFPTGGGLQPASSMPNPYVIEPPESTGRIVAGSRMAFNIVLFGDALRQLPLVCRTVESAMRNGLGAARVRGEVLSVEYEGEAGWSEIQGRMGPRLAEHPRGLRLPTGPAPDALVLEFLTPLRLQQQGRPLGAHELGMRKFVADLLRRVTLLIGTHATGRIDPAVAATLLADASALREERRLEWHDQTRYSVRQGREMTLGGLRGTWRIEGELSRLYPLLWVGQWLHVGKNTTMGHGRYRLNAPSQPCRA